MRDATTGRRGAHRDHHRDVRCRSPPPPWSTPPAGSPPRRARRRPRARPSGACRRRWCAPCGGPASSAWRCPRAWGGPEADPLTQLRVVEALSAADASAGWCAMIGSDGGYWTAFLDDAVGRELYPDLDAYTATSLEPGGRAVAVAGGYRVSGRWRYGSGCRHAAWMVVTCVEPDGEAPGPAPRRAGPAHVLPARPSACTIIDTWTTTGLRGSGSHDYAAADVFVPAERTFRPFAAPVQRAGAAVRAARHVPGQRGRRAPGGRPRRRRAPWWSWPPRKPKPGGASCGTTRWCRPRWPAPKRCVGSARGYVFDAVGAVWDGAAAGGAPSAGSGRATTWRWRVRRPRLRGGRRPGVPDGRRRRPVRPPARSTAPCATSTRSASTSCSRRRPSSRPGARCWAWRSSRRSGSAPGRRSGAAPTPALRSARLPPPRGRRGPAASQKPPPGVRSGTGCRVPQAGDRRGRRPRQRRAASRRPAWAGATGGAGGRAAVAQPTRWGQPARSRPLHPPHPCGRFNTSSPPDHQIPRPGIRSAHKLRFPDQPILIIRSLYPPAGRGGVR